MKKTLDEIFDVILAIVLWQVVVIGVVWDFLKAVVKDIFNGFIDLMFSLLLKENFLRGKNGQ